MIFNMNSGGGGEEIELVSLTATANDTYTPESGQAYNEVVVNVPTGIKFNGGVEHTYKLLKNATVNEGDFCYYAAVTYSDTTTDSGICPLDYSGGTLGTRKTCVAKETKSAGETGTVNIVVYEPT